MFKTKKKEKESSLGRVENPTKETTAMEKSMV